MDSSCLLVSAFWLMEALNCSRLVVVSSTDAACVLVPCDSDCAAAATSPDAPESEPTAPLTSPSTLPKRCTISRIPSIIRAVSSSPRTSMTVVRSPEASLPVSLTPSWSGRTMPRDSTHASSTASTGPTTPPSPASASPTPPALGHPSTGAGAAPDAS